MSYSMYTNHSHELITINVNLSGHDTNMIVDTQVPKSILSKQTYMQPVVVHHQMQLEIFSVPLINYTGKPLKFLGMVTAVAKYKSQDLELHVLVTKGCESNLLCSDWLSHLKMNWLKIHQIYTTHILSSLLDKYSVIFKNELVESKGLK